MFVSLHIFRYLFQNHFCTLRCNLPAKIHYKYYINYGTVYFSTDPKFRGTQSRNPCAYIRFISRVNNGSLKRFCGFGRTWGKKLDTHFAYLRNTWRLKLSGLVGCVQSATAEGSYPIVALIARWMRVTIERKDITRFRYLLVPDKTNIIFLTPKLTEKTFKYLPSLESHTEVWPLQRSNYSKLIYSLSWVDT